MNILARLLHDPRTERVVLGLIVFNAITLGLETSPSILAEHGEILHAVDRAVLAVFVVELLARMIVFRWAFFRDPWSLFDLFVVGTLVLRSEAMRYLSMQKTEAGKNAFRLSELGYRCMAEHVARTITLSLLESASSPPEADGPK